MHPSVASARPPAFRTRDANTWPRSSPRSSSGRAITAFPSSAGFAAMLQAFRATGGTARGEDIARLLEGNGIDDFIGFARLIAAGDVFGFEWRQTLWIPMFQFELRDLSVKPAAQRVLKTLAAGLDAWGRAAWLATPNSWLDHSLPVDLLDTHLAQVQAAAQADRFIAVG